MGGKVIFHKSFPHLLAIALLGLAVYSNSLGVPFVFDDSHTILNNPFIRDISNVPGFFIGAEGPFASRPLMNASNALIYRIGGLAPAGYHAFNLALHILNSVLLYFLVLMTGERLGYDKFNVMAVATLSSLLFAVHPAQTEAVTNVVNRSMLFAATFYFAGLIVFLRAVSSEKKRGLYAAVLFLLSMLGMASREDFATFPAMLVLFDLFFVARFRLREAAGHYKLYIAAAIPLAYLVFLASKNTYDPVTPTLAGLTPYAYVLTELKVQLTYLRLLIFPINQTLDYAYPQAAALASMPAALSALCYLSFCILGLALARKRPAAAFGILWFLILMVPISFGVVFLKVKLDDVIFEHRLYLPAAGIIVAIASGGAALYGKYAKARKPLIAFFTAVVLLFSVAAYARNGVWRSEIRLWHDVIEKAPDKVRGYNNLGYAYEQEGKLDKAIEYYLKALSPDMSPAPALYLARVHFNLANAYGLKGYPEKAMEHSSIAIRLDLRRENAYNTMGEESLKKGALDEAIRHFLKAIEADQYFAPAHYNLGNAYNAKGLPDKAAEEYARAIRLKPDYAEAHLNLGILYKAQGKLDKAIEHYANAIKIRPDWADAHYNIGNAYLLSGQVENAIEHYERALALRPNDPAAHKNLAVAYQQNGMPEKAGEHLRAAEALGRP